ncbi:MAG: hypothetical protein EXS55_04745 [Candidatus Magasanikbacteria bacterium]|nr:hypothetical protein [Candidatus Magasanikbacteria bacterium]
MLSPKAQTLIHSYLNLPFKGLLRLDGAAGEVGVGVRCPYFNNARLKQRGQLRVLVGKGTPKEIAEEAYIISVQKHAGLFEKSGDCCLHNEHTGAPMTADDLRKFLIDNRLGIECSGFVTHVLRTHYLESKKTDILKKLFIVPKHQIARWLISRLRPIENIDVKTYVSERNTVQIIGITVGYDYSKVMAGDVITMLDKTLPFQCNHILVVTDVISFVIPNPLRRGEESLSQSPNDGQRSLVAARLARNDNEADQRITIHYAHSRAWQSEGKYGHGVSEGKMEITAPGKDLLAQTWSEQNKTGEQNETFTEAKTARVIEIRRLKV